MKSCLICHKKENILCSTCRKNPFRVEDARKILAEQGNTKELSKLYDKAYAEIPNLNSGIFWDQRLYKVQPLQEQDGMTKQRIQSAARFIPSHAKKMLDIGAGQGYIEEILSMRQDIDFYANDFSGKAIHNLKKRFNGHFKKENIYQMKYPKDAFDVILALEVLEHIPPSKLLSVLTEIKLLLKKGGIFIVSVPMNEGLEHMETNPNGHVRDYSIALILAELKLAGFTDMHYKTAYAFKSLYTFKKLLSLIFTNKWNPNNVIVQCRK